MNPQALSPDTDVRRRARATRVHDTESLDHDQVVELTERSAFNFRTDMQAHPQAPHDTSARGCLVLAAR
jgi:hypothetical protein